VEAINFEPSNRPSRQQWSGEYVETGMFYMFKASAVEKGLLQSKK